MKLLKSLLLAIFAALHLERPRHLVAAFNGASEEWQPTISLYATTAHSFDYALVKLGAAGYYDLCGANAFPIGVCPDKVASGETGQSRAVHLHGLYENVPMVRVASAVALGDKLFTSSTVGKCIPESALTTGTNYLFGKALEAQATVGAPVRYLPLSPVAVVTA